MRPRWEPGGLGAGGRQSPGSSPLDPSASRLSPGPRDPQRQPFSLSPLLVLRAAPIGGLHHLSGLGDPQKGQAQQVSHAVAGMSLHVTLRSGAGLPGCSQESPWPLGRGTGESASRR